MASRYLALIGDHAEVIQEIEERIRQEYGLEIAYSVEGMSIYLKPGSDQVVVEGASGLIVGCLFDRSDLQSRVHSASIEAGIDDLLKDFWGGYVAIAKTADHDVIFALRDPSGAMPCLYLELPWGTVVASDVNILLGAGLLRPDVNWDFIAKHLQTPNLSSQLTGLIGLKELLPGNSLSLSSKGLSVDQCWSPWNFVNPIPDVSPDILSERLRETITGCVNAWAECFESILLGVSGGLDSSIIASVLAGREDVVCYTIAASDIEGDERAYARILTESLGLRLIESFYDIDDVDLMQTNAAHLPYPIGASAAQSNMSVERKLCKKLDVEVCLTGAGGDSIFCFMQSASPLADIVKSNGLNGHALKTLSDICSLTDSSYWAVIEAALKQLLVKSPKYKWPTNAMFLSSQLVARNLEQYFAHPWLDAPNGALPGKAAHVAKVLGNQMFPDFSPRDMRPWHLSPLNAQPILELCFSIPTWQWVAGGRNRAVARRAFSKMLPEAIVNRRTKGGPTAFICEIAQRNRQKIGEILLGGLLAQRGMIDEVAVRDCIEADRPFRQIEHARLLELVEVEMWVRYWIHHPMATK